MSRRSHRALVLAAAAAVVLLAGSVVVRALLPRGGSGPEAPAATVPAPAPVDLARLEFPCWACRDARDWPVRSRVDLDQIAPLGDGAGNAAVYFRDFAKASGRRAAELAKAREELIPGPADLGEIFPPDHPLLAEAEPWTEQATMRFYPGLLPLEGWNTEIPDFIFALQLAKSWVARGRSGSGDAALEDFRRAVRLGRLLRQEDTTIIQDLVGLACLRLGLEGIYDHRRAAGDLEGALVASVALGEIAPQRLLTSERVARTDVSPYLARDRRSLDLPSERLEALIAAADGGPDRRFRGEATLTLGYVAHLGSGTARERAVQELERLRDGDDERLALLAGWSLDHTPTEEELAELAAR